MAYVDENGLILIDDVEVAEDITKLKTTIDLLDEALDKVKQIQNANSGFMGHTAAAINETSVELINRINAQKEEIETTISFINRVVERYKAIDAKMRDVINSTQIKE